MVFSVAAPPDPFWLSDSAGGSNITSGVIGYRNTTGRSLRSSTINPAVKTLVLISSGQSLLSDVVPTLITPTNASVIDNMNIYDGALYDVAGALLGTTYAITLAPTLGPGNVLVKVADTLITNGKFDRVILAPVSIGGTPVSDWGDVGGKYTNRVTVAMLRLASMGIVPGMTGVTFANIFADGHQDYSISTSQAAWTASCNSYITNTFATGFNGRIFVCSESASGQTSNAIRSAQAAVRNGTTVFDGGDIDSSTIATSDGTHPSDAGASTMATIIYNAMHASGAPF